MGNMLIVVVVVLGWIRSQTLLWSGEFCFSSKFVAYLFYLGSFVHIISNARHPSHDPTDGIRAPHNTIFVMI